MQGKGAIHVGEHAVKTAWDSFFARLGSIAAHDLLPAIPQGVYGKTTNDEHAALHSCRRHFLIGA